MRDLLATLTNPHDHAIALAQAAAKFTSGGRIYDGPQISPIARKKDGIRDKAGDIADYWHAGRPTRKKVLIPVVRMIFFPSEFVANLLELPNGGSKPWLGPVYAGRPGPGREGAGQREGFLNSLIFIADKSTRIRPLPCSC